jgi:hypothetical protein
MVLSSGIMEAASPQNPSPMVEHTRAHPRLKKTAMSGTHFRLSLGQLYVPGRLERPVEGLPLLVHFHGPGWIAEQAAEANDSACLSLQLGSGSAVYAKPFRQQGRFLELLKEAESKAGFSFTVVTLSGWSAGCGAIREILKDPANDSRIGRVILIDGVHTSYRKGFPGPLESDIDPELLASLVRFARRAIAGKKSMLVTHSAIFPGTYASTTETADWMLRTLNVPRIAVLKWGPMKTQQLSEAKKGSFELLGFAGNSAPDHVDQLHALPDLLARSLGARR